MSHRDTVFAPPPGFAALASSTGSPVAAFESPEQGVYGIQFHPEVVHTPYGQDVLRRFLVDVCGCDMTWSAASIVEEQVGRIRAQVGDGKVICGLSGGVDSSVAALLVHRAIGDQLTCVFVDHGLMRKNEGEQVIAAFRDDFGVPLVAVDAEARFLDRLAGVTRARGQAQGDRRGVHPRLRGGGGQARRRELPRPGHAVLRRHRVRRRHRRGDDQVAPQRRRPARGPALRARRAAAHALQGRGPRRRRRARAAREARLAPAVPGPRPGDPRSSAARRRRRAWTSCATPTTSSRTRSAAPACTASSGSPSASCPTSARSASRATSARTATSSSSGP